ncbi:MAG: ATP synthase F1 subunit epsilon [Thermoleophilia bacterium]|nr:ATP synthase F1 subunit epsilon [Thermoleophilia bacterium]
MVVAPSVMGEVGILPRHAPLIAVLRVGETRLKGLDGEDTIFATTAGYMTVEEDTVLILVEEADHPDAIDRGAAEAALREAEERLQAAGDDEAREQAEAALHRAKNRLKVVDKGA